MKRNKTTTKRHHFQKKIHRNRFYEIVKMILRLGSILSRLLGILGTIYFN